MVLLRLSQYVPALRILECQCNHAPVEARSRITRGTAKNQPDVLTQPEVVWISRQFGVLPLHQEFLEQSPQGAVAVVEFIRAF